MLGNVYSPPTVFRTYSTPRNISFARSTQWTLCATVLIDVLVGLIQILGAVAIGYGFPRWRFTRSLARVGNFTCWTLFALGLFSFVLVFVAGAVGTQTTGISKSTKTTTGTRGRSCGIGGLSFFALLAPGQICISGRSFPTDWT